MLRIIDSNVFEAIGVREIGLTSFSIILLCLMDLLSVQVLHLQISMSLELYPPVTNC